MTVEKELAKRKRILEKYYASITQAIKKEPDGRIRTTRIKEGLYEYFLLETGRSARARYIHKDDTKQISALLQKRYNHKVVKILEAQISAINTFEKNYQLKKITRIMN